jgi:uncharacterized protein (DUF3084 family)
MTTRYGWVLGAAALGLAIGAGGCCAGKIQECNKLIAQINATGDQIEKASAKLTASKNDKNAIEDFAKTLEKGADDIKAVEVKDEALKGYSKEYHDMLDKTAKALRDMQKAVAAGDQAAAAKADAEVNKLNSTESALVAKVNGYCGGK